MDLQLRGHRVVVTAGASGIGRWIATAFANEGANVFVCDLDEQALAALANEAPYIGTCHCDISNEDGVGRMTDAAVAALGGLDCLVNNAGSVGPTLPAGEISAREWARCVDINLTGTFYCTNRALTHLRHSTNPSVISLSSAAGRLGYPNKSPYAAAKWGIIGFMKTVSMEYGADGIRCNTILPGPVDNPTMQKMIADKARLLGIAAAEQKQKYLALSSLKSFVTPAEIADLIVFLSSIRARSISGQAISIDCDLQALV
jgi:NAD(P)-dependent dehydrogenase (short-subunit alcohol dehydrogenase family)